MLPCVGSVVCKHAYCKCACSHVQPTVSGLRGSGGGVKSGKRRRRRPVVKASTKAKDSTVLAGTQ